MKYPTSRKSPSKTARAAISALIVSAGPANATTIFRLDMERTLTETSGNPPTGSITETGWLSSAADNGGSSATLPTPAGITITAGGLDGIFQGRSGGTWGSVDVTDADWNDLVGDTTAARNGNGTVIISLTGLGAFEHTLTAWHNVSATDSASFSNGLYAITPSLSTGTLGGTLVSGAASNVPTGTTATSADFNNSVISFTPDGGGNATVVLTSASGSGFLTLSGIEVTAVPEPSGMSLLALGGFSVFLRRRRS